MSDPPRRRSPAAALYSRSTIDQGIFGEMRRGKRPRSNSGRRYVLRTKAVSFRECPSSAKGISIRCIWVSGFGVARPQASPRAAARLWKNCGE